MMKTFLLVLAAACCLTACKKSTPLSPGLFGKWELREGYGGIAGFDSVYKAGNGRICLFKSDSSYAFYNKSKLLSSGIFHIRPLTGAPLGQPYQIFFDNLTYGEPFIIKGTRMTIGTIDSDGIAADYEKIGN